MELEKNEVLNDLLGFEGMKIIQRNDMLNFSLDSILLANFISIPQKTKLIVDFGTGNAPIPLFLSARTQKPILGLDIQEEAVALAKKNVALNELEHQIEIKHHDIKETRAVFESQMADVIVSNPPFFRNNERRQINENEYLAIARHEIALSLEQLIENASYLLNNNGYFSMVHRPDRFIEIVTLLQKYSLEPKRVQFIYPKEGKEAHMFLIEARKNGNVGLKILEPLIVHEEDGSYRKEIETIFRR